MSEEEIRKAILTLDTLIDCNKEDGTYYNAQKEWEALEVFKKLQQENTYLKKSLENAQDIYKNSHKYTSECEDKVIELKSVLKEIREYIKEHTMYFDSKYARDYGELCSMAGAGDTRVHCVIGDKELLEIIDKGIGEDK